MSESWTNGRQAFVIVGRQRGGTLIHYTDDPLFEPEDPQEVATSKVTALCGQYTRNAVLADAFDFTDPSLHVCPRCQRVNR